ncbi:hypothetical protein OG604_38025 [Streptomyces sp. NBC_01231]|nr:hypothetical protein OG604_38025 [Streptomyces sp. NBC_01231]
MTVDQLPGQVREFANHLDGLLARLDQGGGWCGVFWQRDPDGMQACLDGREMPPWDVVEALLQDLAGAYGSQVAAAETARARALHAAALVAYDARPGGRDALGDRFDVMLREQRYAADRQAELGRSLASATTQEEADALRVDLAWAHDDHERATRRCAELRSRMAQLDRRVAGEQAQAIRRGGAVGDGATFGARADLRTDGGVGSDGRDGYGGWSDGYGSDGQRSDGRGVGARDMDAYGSGSRGPGGDGSAEHGSDRHGASDMSGPGGRGVVGHGSEGHATQRRGVGGHGASDGRGVGGYGSIGRGADVGGAVGHGSDGHDAERHTQRHDDRGRHGTNPPRSGPHGPGAGAQWEERDSYGGRPSYGEPSGVRGSHGGGFPSMPRQRDHDARSEDGAGHEGRSEAGGAFRPVSGALGAEQAPSPTYDPRFRAPRQPAPADSSAAPRDQAYEQQRPTPTESPARRQPAPADSSAAPRDQAHDQPRPTPAAPPAGQQPAPKQRKRRRGGARFAGMVEEEAAPVVVPPTAVPDLPAAPVASGRSPRGARFAGAARADARPEPQVEPLDAAGGRETAQAVERLVRLRGEGRSGEAHALLAEIAGWPAARYPLLAVEMERASLGADWATLLWEAASLPAQRLVAAADALVAAGRGTDGEQVLRQGVARPADEIGHAVRALAAEGRHREVRALLDAYVRVRTPEEAARSAEPDPHTLVPLLLEAAQGVSDQCHWDLVHALRVAGFSA